MLRASYSQLVRSPGWQSKGDPICGPQPVCCWPMNPKANRSARKRLGVGKTGSDSKPGTDFEVPVLVCVRRNTACMWEQNHVPTSTSLPLSMPRKRDHERVVQPTICPTEPGKGSAGQAISWAQLGKRREMRIINAKPSQAYAACGQKLKPSRTRTTHR